MFRGWLSKIVPIVMVLGGAAGAWAQPAPAQGPAPAVGPAAASAYAAAPAPVADQTGGAVVSDKSYSLGVGDVIDVTLVGRPEFNARARIGSDGEVVIPLLGAIPATDKTPAQLAQQIGVALEKGGFYAKPNVRVDVVGVSSKYATVLGAVGNPGLIPLDRNYRLSEILARVGGRGASGAEYVLLTPANGPTKRFRFDALATGGPAEDPMIQPGDKIFVPAAENEVFYASGEVKSPGAYTLIPNMTVRMALARAGGLTQDGSEGRVKLVRNGKEVAKVELDSPIQAGDVITVGARLF